MDETIEAIEAQYDIALNSEVASRLTEAQRSTGVKDAVAQPILEWLQARGSDLISPDSGGDSVSRAQATVILSDELTHKTSLRMNPLLSLPGRSSAINFGYLLTLLI